jgi:hypothetical protein
MNSHMLSCRTRLVKLECLKYLEMDRIHTRLDQTPTIATREGQWNTGAVYPMTWR